MSQKPDGFVGGWSDACQCEECQRIAVGIPTRPCICHEHKPFCDCEASNAEPVAAVLKGARAC